MNDIIEAQVNDVIETNKEISIENQEDLARESAKLMGIKGLEDKVRSVFDPIVERAHKTHKEAISQRDKYLKPLKAVEDKIKEKIKLFNQSFCLGVALGTVQTQGNMKNLNQTIKPLHSATKRLCGNRRILPTLRVPTVKGLLILVATMKPRNPKEEDLLVIEAQESQETPIDLTRLICIFVCIFCFSTPVFSNQDKCQDPETLPPQLKKAYYQLKEAEKQIPGMKVAIRCGDKLARGAK